LGRGANRIEGKNKEKTKIEENKIPLRKKEKRNGNLKNPNGFECTHGGRQ